MPKGVYARPPIAERFWKFIEPIPEGSGCWEWTGARNNMGYGQIGTTSCRHMLAHRFSWELHNGPIGPGLLVLHRCDNPACVNPAHLFLGTHRENAKDAVVKGRWYHGGAPKPYKTGKDSYG